MSGNKATVYAREEETLIITTYDENDTVVNVKRETVFGEKEFNITVPDKCKIKLMLWKDNMIPLCEAVADK